MHPVVAILTGDLIGSTKAGPAAVERAMAVLEATAEEISHWQADGADTRFTRFRGDGWQILLTDPTLALRAAVTLMARLRASETGLDTRLAIGIGQIDRLGSNDLSDAAGAAFVFSGRALDAMKRADRMAIMGLEPIRLHRSLLDLIDERLTRWTPEQAEAAARYLHPDSPTLNDIGADLGISPQAVSYRLTGAGAPRLRHVLHDWEDELFEESGTVMIETFTALVFAHVLADFVFQTGWMIANKRAPQVLLLHAAIVLVLSQAALGQVAAPAVLALAAAHLAIDVVKTYASKGGLAAFLLDQATHLGTIAAVAVLSPGLWAAGAWAALPAPLPLYALHLALLAGGLVAATRAGGFAVGMLMEAHTPRPAANGAARDAGREEDRESDKDELPRGGQTIGLLERGLIFLLVLVGQPAGIGFLIAAKSILRFGAVSESRAASEYVIIGTLASFGWALVTAYATAVLLDALPPLEMAPLPH